MGKVARVAIATGGMITATLVLLTATVVTTGAWAMVMVGVAVAALSIRAARLPTMPRLVLVAVALMTLPLLARFL